MTPDITTVRIEKRQNRAQILALAFQESLEEGLFCRSPVVNEVVLDDCVDATGEIALWALEIVRYFDSYTELSATGTGLHVIARGDVPNRRKGDVEVYSSKRFFTVTGHVVEVSGD